MDIKFKFDLDGIDWSEVVEIFRLAPLGIRDPEKFRRSCENSFLVCFAFFNDKLIGMGRAISDGEYQAAIYDLVILPEFQGQGLGSQILKELHKKLDVETIMLYSVPGKEPFYMKLGYSKMLTAMARKTKETDVFRLNGYID